MNLFFALTSLPFGSSTAIYAVLFSILILSGFGLPVPEEVTLLLGGYLAYLGIIEFWPTVYTLILGILAADIAGYLFGRHAGKYLTDRLERFRYARLFLEQTNAYFSRYGEWMVLVTRPLFGVRVVVPMLAGNCGMNFLKFFVFDALGAIPWTFLLVSASYYFGLGIDLLTEVREIKHIIIIGSVVFILALAGRVIVKERRRHPMRTSAEPSQSLPESREKALRS